MSAGRQYRLLRELGTGTFGTVYQAEMTSAAGFKKQVALKVLHPMWEADKDAARRFRDEARLLGQLRHRHIVQVDGLVKVGGRWAVVMEFVPGCDGNVVLKACRKAGEAFPVPAALEVGAAVASALDAAYNARPDAGEPLRVIHRDIKPSNIRLTEDGDVKVLDFGIARADFQGREAVTQSVRYGSVRYMAPERHHSAPDTPAGDVFALGCVLFELLTGKPLGNVEAEWAQHHEKVHAKVARLREGLGAEGKGIVDLLMVMLSFEPEKRPSAAEVADRARQLARTYPGEDLPTFARRFLPQVSRFIPDTSMPIERVVSEGGGSSEEVVQSRSKLPPVLTESGEEAGGGFDRQRVLALIGAIAGASLVLLIVGSVQMLASGQDTPMEPPAEVPEEPPAATGIAHTPDPQPEPEPEPEPQPEPEPPVADAAPDTTTTTVASVTPAEPRKPKHGQNPGTTTESPKTAVVTPPTPGAKSIRAVKFTHTRASAIKATCAGASNSGTTSVLVRELYPGPCDLTVNVGGNDFTTRVDVTGEHGFVCDVAGDVLTCK
jgi:serine/threonine protein kinase